MTGLSSRAMLVSLHISQWSARKLDKGETRDVEIKHGVKSNVARVNKSLLPGAESLDAIHKLSGTIRTEFYRRSLPWSHGTQIIKSTGFLEFNEVMSNYRTERAHLVDAFCADYPLLKADAPQKLKGLYREEDYPPVSEIRHKFHMGVSYMPVPDAADWRVDVSDENLEVLRESITRNVERSVGEAMQDAWKRIYDTVSKIHERLADPDNIFRDSLVENAVDLCRILPDLNINDDPNLEALRRELEGSICNTTPDTLRNSVGQRERVADKMADIMAKMGAFYAA